MKNLGPVQCVFFPTENSGDTRALSSRATSGMSVAPAVAGMSTFQALSVSPSPTPLSCPSLYHQLSKGEIFTGWPGG